MGAALAQLDEHNDEKPIAFFSKRLSDIQKKYAITKQEMLALVSAIRHFHTYPMVENLYAELITTPCCGYTT